MRNLLAILICCQLFASSINAQEIAISPSIQNYSREEYGLVGPVHEITENDSESPLQATTIFNSKGKVVELLLYVNNMDSGPSKKAAALLGKSINTYSSTGKLEKITTCFGEVEFCHETILDYDFKGRVKEMKLKNPDGSVVPSRIYIYEASKLTYVDFEYDDKGSKLIRKSVYKQEAQGKWIRRDYRADGVFEGKIVYSYDSRNNLAKQVISDEKNSVSFRRVFTYKFDSHGNWTERRSRWMFGNGKVLSKAEGVAKRDIKYY